MSYGKIDPWKAGAVFAVIILPVAAMAYNAMHAFPASKTTIVLFAGITALCAVLIELKTSEKDSFLRQTGIIILFALAIVSVGGLALHGALGRDLSLAGEAETAYAKAKKEYESRFDQLHDQELENKGQDAENARIELEREKLRLAQNIERRRQGLSPLPEPKRKRSDTGEVSREKLAPPEQPETQTDVIKRFAPYNFWAQFIDMLLSVAGLAFIMAVRQWDANSDGCPDWIEREAKIIPEKEFAKRHPEWYDTFYPNGTPIALSDKNSTVNAESSRRIGFNPSPSLPTKTEIESRLDADPGNPQTAFDDTSKTRQKIPQVSPPVSPPKNSPHADAVLAYDEEYKKEYNKEWIDEDPEDVCNDREGESDGQKWAKVKNTRIPIISGTRWKSHKKRGYVECWLIALPEEGKSNYLGMINKKILLKAKTLSDEQSLDFFTSLIDQWKRKRENPKLKSPLTPEEN